MGIDEAGRTAIWSDQMTILSDRAIDSTATLNATEFKATCLDILDRLSRRELTRVAITKRGRVVAVLNPPDDDAEAVRALHGCMGSSVVIPVEVDLTAPVLGEPFMAEDGALHG